MARLNYDDVREAYERALRLAIEAGVDTNRWRLVPGKLGNEETGQRRTPWRIEQGKRRVFTLGYTVASAKDILNAIGTAIELVLSADTE